jgi:catechol 2,3-dioxygenase-like lactoylglutathione lyase family enzyme
MALRLNQVTMIVRDFEGYKKFLKDLGMRIIVDAPPRYARFEIPGNSATISIEVTEDAAQMAGNQSQLFFELPSRKELDQYCDDLEKKGFKFKELPEQRDQDYLWREARLITPENHDIRFYYAGKNRLYPPWRVDGEGGEQAVKKAKESSL